MEGNINHVSFVLLVVLALGAGSKEISNFLIETFLSTLERRQRKLAEADREEKFTNWQTLADARNRTVSLPSDISSIILLISSWMGSQRVGHD